MQAKIRNDIIRDIAFVIMFVLLLIYSIHANNVLRETIVGEKRFQKWLIQLQNDNADLKVPLIN